MTTVFDIPPWFALRLLAALLPVLALIIFLLIKSRKPRYDMDSSVTKLISDPNPNGTGDLMVFVVGRLAGSPGVLVISVPPTGKTMYYCEKHNELFDIKRGAHCSKCAGQMESARALPI